MALKGRDSAMLSLIIHSSPLMCSMMQAAAAAYTCLLYMSTLSSLVRLCHSIWAGVQVQFGRFLRAHGICWRLLALLGRL